VPASWHSLLVHPHAVLETRRARQALQGSYALGEFVAQSANLALVLSGCHRSDAALVRAGLRDVLVEPRRAGLIAGFEAARDAALSAHAMGAGISGAGPSVFAWFEDADQARAAAAPVQAAFAAAGFDSDAWVSPLDAPGARCAESFPLDTEPMQFVSTRGQSPAVGLSAAIAAGLAPDGGLYVPRFCRPRASCRPGRPWPIPPPICWHRSSRAMHWRLRFRRSAARRSTSRCRCVRSAR
jgi:hypothetical protein